MSDVTGASPVAPPAPVITAPELAPPVAPAVPAAAPEPLTEGKDRHSARQRARQRGSRVEREAADRTQADAARDRALGQPRTPAGTPEGGEFVKGGAPAAPPAPAAATPAQPTTGAPAAPAEATTSTPSGAPAPAGLVDIPLPEGHPLRQRGRTHLRVAADSEQDARHGINEWERRTLAEAERDTLLEQHALLEARQKALTGDLTKYRTDPKWLTLIEQVRAAPGFGDAMADQILAGLTAREDVAVRDAQGQAVQELDQRRMAERIEGEILGTAQQTLKIWANAGEVALRLPNLIKEYFTACDKREAAAGRTIPPTSAEFFEWVKPAYRNDPRVQQEITNLRASEQKMREDAVRAEERRKLEAEQAAANAEAARRRSGLPPTSRSLPAGTTTAPVTEAPPAAPVAPQFGQHRKAARERAAERGRAYGQPQR